MRSNVRQTSAALAAILLLGALSSALAYDSLNMRIVGRWPFTGCQLGVGDTARNLCFAACGGGVYVLDITDPAHPQKLSERIQTGGIVRDLYFDHALSRLYVACEEGGLELWDVRTASAPYRLGVCPTPSRAWSVLVSGRYAFIANREQGVSILDILDPASPHEVGRYDTPGDARDMAVVGQRLFVADLSTLQVLDWTNPQNIVPVGELGGISATGIVTDGRYAFLSSGGMAVVDIRDPYHPTQVGYCNTTSATLDIALVGDYVYVACDAFGLNFIDITNPTAPVRTGQMNLTWGNNVKVVGRRGYAMGNYLYLLDTSTPAQPRNVGNFTTWTLYGGVAVQGDYAYLTSWDGLTIVSIADLGNTFEVGRVDVPGWNTDVVVQGDYAYVGSQGSGTSVVDISDPADPRVLSTVADRVVCERLAVRDSLVFVAGQRNVPILNVSDPLNPRIVSVFDSLASAYGVAVYGGLMIVADGLPQSGGLRLVDVADPAHPALLGTLPPRYITNDVAVSDSLAYIAEFDSGMSIVNIVNPREPSVVGSLALPGRADYIAVCGTHAYVVALYSGVRLVDVSNPSAPCEIGYHTRPYGRKGITARGGLAYLADGGLGLMVLEDQVYGVQGPRRQLLRGVPIRVRGSLITDGKLVIEQSAALPGRLDLVLYDATGRAARIFADVQVNERTTLQMSGVASGVYYLRADSGEWRFLQKLTIVNRR